MKDKHGQYKTFIKILWDTGEETWELLSEIKESDPITVAQYALENNLMDKPQWKWANKYIKNPQRFLRYTRQLIPNKKTHATKYKFGVKVPRTIKEAIKFDEENKNTL